MKVVVVLEAEKRANVRYTGESSCDARQLFILKRMLESIAIVRSRPNPWNSQVLSVASGGKENREKVYYLMSTATRGTWTTVTISRPSH